MKVGTDGVLIGAWATINESLRILDVGTGTGLIACMLAQRSDAIIDAIEIDPDAAIQAKENVKESPWADRIRVICTSFQAYCKNPLSRYDLIICNPPFFINSLKAKTQSRRIARHNHQLEMKELLSGAQSLLNPHGHLCIIFPADKESYLITISKEFNLFPGKILRIRPVPGKVFKRVLMDFSFANQPISETEMTIETGSRHQYSQEYLDLTRDYYLHN